MIQDRSATAKSRGNSNKTTPERRFKVRYVFYFGIAVMLLLSIVSYSGGDYNIICGGSDNAPANWIGNIGAYLSHWLFLWCGLAVYIMLALLGLAVVRALLPGPPNRKRFFLGALFIMLGGMMLFAISPETFGSMTDKLGIGRIGAARQAVPGGVLGQALTAPSIPEHEISGGLVRRMIGPVGSMVFGWTLLFAGMIMIYLADFHQFVKRQLANGLPQMPSFGAASDDDEEDVPDPMPASRRSRLEQLAAIAEKSEPEKDGETPPRSKSRLLSGALAALNSLKNKSSSAPGDTDADNVGRQYEPQLPESAETPDLPVIPEAPQAEPPRIAPAATRPAESGGVPQAPFTMHGNEVNTKITEQGRKAGHSLLGGFTLPPSTMLSKGPEAQGEDLHELLRCKETLQRTLDSFNVSGTVVDYISGPRVTRYEIQLAPGVSVKKVENLESNIAMEMEAKSVRILAPIPGKNLVGVEAPNSHAEAVFMRSIMETAEWHETKAGIPIILGKNVAGKPVVLDLAKAPHLLIAGSTGSGKSVCMNTLIMSMIFRFRPDELRLILVDPKIVEFEDYKTLPHLITPVINDSQKVPIALRWAVSEMERRYRVLAKAGVKNLAGFNSRPRNEGIILDHDGLPIPDTMPVLVVIVDELADLMMTEAKKDVETSIARIAQKGRAAGIHIVIATQRPSREIITGVIRANLPTKIAFMVGKRVDSQVILDQNGAEALLGKGDMLFLPPGVAALERIQGAMVDDNDIKEVVKFVSAQAPQEFNESVTAEASENGEDDEDDDMAGGNFDDDDYRDIEPVIRKYLQPGDGENVRKALEIVIMERKASTSYLQRRLGIGYNKAAELIDLFETRGIIGPQTTGGGKREVLIFDDIVND